MLPVENVALLDLVCDAEVEDDENKERDEIGEQQKDQISVDSNVGWILGKFWPFHNGGADVGVSRIVISRLDGKVEFKTSGYVDDDGGQDGRDDVDVVPGSGALTEVWLVNV